MEDSIEILDVDHLKEIRGKATRESHSYKGENGKVGIIGGSKNYSGAPALNAEASLRAGCDLIRILTSVEVSNVVRSYSENFIVEAYETDYFNGEALKEAVELRDWADTVVIGSGLSLPEHDALRDFAELSEIPLVVDADAIGPISCSDFNTAVFTPHEKEADKIRENFGSLEDFVRQEDAVIVLKGKTDIVYTPAGKFQITRGHETMTVGGTGDVLAGIIGSLISQGLNVSEAAKLGTWINGKAGEIAAEEYGNGTLATDIVEEIPEALKPE